MTAIFYHQPHWAGNDLIVGHTIVGHVSRERRHGVFHWVGRLVGNNDVTFVGRPLVGGHNDLDVVRNAVLFAYMEVVAAGYRTVKP